MNNPARYVSSRSPPIVNGGVNGSQQGNSELVTVVQLMHEALLHGFVLLRFL
jgi:hypothetical protein